MLDVRFAIAGGGPAVEALMALCTLPLKYTANSGGVIHDVCVTGGVIRPDNAQELPALSSMRPLQVGLDHVQVGSVQAVVQAAGDRASRFRANGRRRRHRPARPLNRDDAAAGEEST